MMAVDLGRMYGPLPLGAWGAVIAGGLGLALYTRRQNAAEVPTDPDQMPEDTGTTPGVGVGGSGQWTNVSPPANGSADTSSAETNDQWGVMVIAKMIGNSYPAGPTNAGITKFLNQGQLDAQEYAIVSEALRRFGSPPTPVPGPFGPGAVAPPPSAGSPRWPVPKAPFFQYTIQSGDTLAIIGSHYGIAGGTLYAWNAAVLDYRARKTGNKTSSMQGKYIYAGTPIVIPWRLPGMHYTP